MKKIFVIMIMVLMAATSQAQTAKELMQDIEYCNTKIKEVRPIWIGGMYYMSSTMSPETDKANIEAWKNRIDNDMKKIGDLFKTNNKEVDHIEHPFVDYDELVENFEMYSYEFLKICFTDGTSEVFKINQY